MPTPETLFQTRWLSVQRIDHWDFVRRPHSDCCVGILAITPEQEIVLVEQFRIPVQRRVIEIPAGIVGDESEHRGEAARFGVGVRWCCGHQPTDRATRCRRDNRSHRSEFGHGVLLHYRAGEQRVVYVRHDLSGRHDRR
jgi:hypothetical protein